MIGIITLILSLIAVLPKADPSVLLEKEVRSKVVKVELLAGECTGSYVKGKSGKTYILTAAHCATAEIEEFEVEGNDKLIPMTLVARDEKADIAIYSAPKHDGLCIAKEAKPHTRIMSVSHGHGLPAFRTEGELVKTIAIQDDRVLVITTMPIIPGSSGAPVVNPEGCVLGTVSVVFPDNFMTFSGISQLSAIQKILSAN